MTKRKRTEVDVEVVRPKEGAIAPFVCYFPSGKPNTSGQEDVEFSLYAGQDTRAGYMVVGSQENVDYVGKTNGPEYANQLPCTYAVGVYDRATKKLQVLPIQGARVCRMEPKLPTMDYGQSEYEAQDMSSREQKLALNKRLVDSFGSTRRRRQLTAREEGIVRTEKLSAADALAGVISQAASAAAAQGLSKEAIMARASAIRNVPPHHTEACTPEGAYPLEELIPPGALQALDVGRFSKAAKDTATLDKWRANKHIPSYITNRLHLLRDPDANLAQRRGRLLAFLSALLALHRAGPVLKADPEKGGLEQLGNQFRVREEVLTELLALFYQQSQEGSVTKYERSDTRKELLRAYILVTALLLEGGLMAHDEFDTLTKELKLSANELLPRFKEVGATCHATTFKQEAEDGSTGTGRSYNVHLLRDPAKPDGLSGKTLGAMFPQMKLTKQKR